MAPLGAFSLSGHGKRRHPARIRHVVVGQYVALYRVAERRVEIVRIVHGHRHITADDIDP
jgi:toxin ParE1/3/4